MVRRILAGLAVGAPALVVAPAASASIMPTLMLDQSSGTAAASTANLGMDLKFAPSGIDSPKDLTLKLHAGLLANASIDGARVCTRRLRFPRARSEAGRRRPHR